MQQIVSDHMRGARSGLTSERATLETAYGMIDRHMASRTWISGHNFSMADCAAAPALFYASTVQPLPDDFNHLKAYLDRLTERPSFRRVIEEAKPYFSVYPFANAIPKRFRQESAQQKTVNHLVMPHGYSRLNYSFPPMKFEPFALRYRRVFGWAPTLRYLRANGGGSEDFTGPNP